MRRQSKSGMGDLEVPAMLEDRVLELLFDRGVLLIQ